ncbi:hypothetical protein Tco_0695800 [Tanacetum coccineum]
MQITLRPLTLPISMKDFQENSDDEADERSCDEYLRDLELDFHERALLANSKCFIKKKNNFFVQKANEDIECYNVAKKGHFDEEEVSDDEEKTQVKVLMDLAADELSVGNNHACNGEWIDIVMKKANTKPKKKILGDEQLTESSSQNDGKENPFITVSLDYDYEMVQKSKDWVERLNPDSKLPNFNTGRILQAVNECL